MKNKIEIFSPVKTPCDIELLSKNTSCKNFYVYHHKFLNGNFTYLLDFINTVTKNNCNLFLNFKHNITENTLNEVYNFLQFLKNTNINGIFINNYAILKMIKGENLPYKIIIDSYFDIHNLMSIEFTNSFFNVDKVIVTEEIYLKNIQKIRKYIKKSISLAIDTDNLPFFSEEIQKLNVIDSVIIKGDFNDKFEILNAVTYIQNILSGDLSVKNKKLPFKHIRKSFYSTNHFSGEIISSTGNDFKFSSNIRKFNWNIKRTRLKSKIDYKSFVIPNLNLRVTSLSHLKCLEKFIKKIGFNPVKSIEFGEIVNTYDLSIKSFNEIMNEVKLFCKKYNIDLQISTPRILIERDFDRVYDYVKALVLTEPKPDSLVINNIGFFQNVVNDEKLKDIKIELGQGLNILNSSSILCLNDIKPIYSVYFTSFENFVEMQSCICKIKEIIPNRKFLIGGNIKIPTLGLCPLNNDSAIVSRLSCKAPCHSGNYALKDPSLNKILPFTVDGFCRMHLYRDDVLDNYNMISILKNIGITDFTIDLCTFDGKYTSVFLTKFLNALKF